MRETTERPEAIEAGVTQLVGTSVAKIVRIVTNLLNNPNEYKNLSNRANPFGNGLGAEIIESILAKIMNI